ncbi:carbon catabolite repression protein CreD [Sporothrix schenckii 1099-18]|uniref:Arrestin C-terminal-like domain-containing protein n=2 Tax=Sporothrix schenckii TaxID=29908 RepID=U7Q426_SPOS1|nr:carbon catabolite repression protein CreD [Sporothrix schenckii 1099-18]ERT01907.1 hypothetical protein HMPREF1624_00202 [Sporothrix schenckii ATCC 58251]KJR80941.1 carbon catabolite repression protein CreD [Sporothrix schenckii 1099-18]
MPFNPFTAVTGRHALTLFDIRLENDFIVFRGNEHEAGGQLLKGVLAICVPTSFKIDDIHLRLTGTQRLVWSDPKVTPSGLTSSKIDRTSNILTHQWPSFKGTPGKTTVLEKGNHEFPFELMLPGDTCESVEGLHEASITYKLKATIVRGKLAYDLHTYKHVRIVRTLESSALEFLHAMSVENIWPNKVEYSIVVPQKAVVFGSHIPLECRFTPLLKGLELGDITVRLVEIHEFVATPPSGSSSSYHAHTREFKNEKLVQSWTVGVNRDEHWQDMIEDTGQEGWVVNTSLDLPRKLGRCIQDVNVHGIKVRHKLKMVVALKNPDGHVSELRATLPLTIFISPNIPLDEQGNLTAPTGSATTNATNLSTIAPPGYGEHILDQLYDEVDVHNLQTPAPMSAIQSPMYGMSRAGSSENLASMHNPSIPVHPAALTSRLQDVSAREVAFRRNNSSSILTPPGSSSDMTTPFTPMHLPHAFMQRSHSYAADLGGLANGTNGHSSAPTSGTASGNHSHPQSEAASRRNSGESRHSTGNNSEQSEPSGPEHIDFADLQELNKVPSYATAIKTSRVNKITVGGDAELPDYRTAASRPAVPRTLSTASTASLPANLPSSSNNNGSSSTSNNNSASGLALSSGLTSEPLSLIAEAPQESAGAFDDVTGAPASRASSNDHNSGASDNGDGITIARPPRLHQRSRTAGYHPEQMSTSPGSGPGAGSGTGSSGRRRPLSGSVSFLHTRHSQSPSGDSDERGWLQLLQARGRVAT